MTRISPSARARLRRAVASFQREHGAEGEPAAAGELNVVPFLDIVVNVVMFVLATLAVTFTSTIQTTTPRLGPAPRGVSTAPLALTVLVVPDGFAVKARGGNVAPGCDGVGAGLTVPKRGAAWDFEGLNACVTKIKAAAPDAAADGDVTISANPEVKYETVVATMDALRTSTSGDPLFPEVSLGVPR